MNMKKVSTTLVLIHGDHWRHDETLFNVAAGYVLGGCGANPGFDETLIIPSKKRPFRKIPKQRGMYVVTTIPSDSCQKCLTHCNTCPAFGLTFKTETWRRASPSDFNHFNLPLADDTHESLKHQCGELTEPSLEV